MTTLRIALFLVLASLLPAAAQNQCDALLDPEPELISDYAPDKVQRGLRTALRSADRRLSDGTMGRFTMNALRRLCAKVPTGDTDIVTSTFELALEYDALTLNTGPSEVWRQVLFGDRLRDKLLDPETPAEEALPLRLASTPLMKAKALGDPTVPFFCRAARAAIAPDPSAQSAAQALYARFSVVSPSAICQILPTSGEGSDFAAAMSRLAEIEESLTGALDDLGDPQFAAWLAEGPKDNLLRLTGTKPAVIRLILDFRNRALADPIPAPTDPCALTIQDTTTTFFSLSAEEIAGLEKSVDLKPLLEGFAADNPSFGSAQTLWVKLEEALAGLDECILPTIEDIVRGSDQLGLSFQLDAEAAKNLMVQPDLQDALPVIEEFLEVSAPTEKQLINGIKAALDASAKEIAEAEIEEAADVVAAAAEPVEPLLDTPSAQVPIPEEDPPAPTTGVTDATALALEQSITNPDFVKALLGEDFLPATKPELLKGEVRSILRPIAEEQNKQKVASDLKSIAPTATGSWSMTPQLQRAILENSYIATVQSDPSGADLAERMKTVAGIQYPSERLFQEALKTVPSVDGGIKDDPFSQGMITKITSVAMKEVDRPTAPRLTSGFAKPGCGCVPHPNTNPEVYSFYPFWFAPVDEIVEVTEEDPDAEAPPPTPQKIDFSLLDRVAYYGLEFNIEQPVPNDPTRNLTLKNARHWAAAKRAFVNEAHRHRAKVDVSFDLRNWQDWTMQHIEEVVTRIAGQMAPFEKLPSYKFADLRKAWPTIFDIAQPDGLTLIFHGYESNRLSPDEMTQMINIITSIYEALPNRDRLEINVAFDFALVADDYDADAPEDGLFDELYNLLITRTIIVQEQKRDANGLPLPAATTETKRDTVQIINRILFFLERETSDAKKSLRSRMEQGLFQGAERANVLRSIIPVLPPSGHEFVQRSVKAKRPAEQRETFGQFEDDVIYFKDNFAGVGFWPIPLVDGAETPDIEDIIRAQFDNDQLPAVLASFETSYDTVCTWACPNRAYIALGGMLLFLIMSLLTWRSYYSGRVEKFSFQFLIFGAVGLSNAALFVILLVLTNCDTDAYVAPVLLYAFIALVALVVVGNLINRARNGPAP